MYLQYLKTVSLKNRKGVISTIRIPAGEPICEFKGTIYTDKQLEELKDKIVINDVLQVAPNLYIGPSGNATDHIAHSCNPNCVVKAVGQRAILYSLYVIAQDQEITFDYSSSSTDTLETWQMQCRCGSFNCRKVISGFYHLDKNIQEEYKKNGIAALFIRAPIFTKK